MRALDRYLAFLGRDNVDELVLQTGRAAYVKLGGQYHPATKEPLTAAHLQKLWAGTPVVRSLATGHDLRNAEIEGPDGTYLATVTHRQGLTQIRVTRQGTAAADSSTVAAATVSPSQPTESTFARELKTEQPTATPRPTGEARPLTKATAEARPPTNAPPHATALLSAEVEHTEHAVFAKTTPGVGENNDAPRPSRAQTLGRLAPNRPASSPAGPLAVLVQARADNASDVHFLSHRPPAIRRTGDLLPCGTEMTHDELARFVDELMTAEHRDALDQRGYADFATNVDKAGRLRVNVCRQQNGIKACFRLVPDAPPSPNDLGLPPEVAKVGKHHQGLVVVSGPNGHGKTTTMAALLDALNRERPIHIITVEDPVEIVFPIRRAIVNQREVGSHTASFQRALKAALREDPDVIAIGELRDQETVSMALNAAETGHLVLATMSTPSGATTIDRLIDMFPPDEQTQVRATLAATLKLIVSQRLVPRASGQGRVAAVELISGNLALSSLIRDNKLFQLPSLLQRGRAYGMIRLEDSLTALVAAGTITRETAVAFADDARRLAAEEPDPAATANEPAAPEKTNRLRGLFGGQ